MYIITESAITIFTDRPHTFARANIPPDTWAEALDLIKESDWSGLVELLTPKKVLSDFFAPTGGSVQIEDGVFRLNGEIIDNHATRKALQFAKEGLPVAPILGFIERVMRNPSYRATQALYEFLEAGQLPLTPEGKFLAYRKVRKTEDGNYVDIYTGTMNNNPETVVSMPRNQVDEDPEQTCSAGLHVCSHKYLPHFGCGRWDTVMVVEVDPEHVVAVPKDYNNAKMRVCQFKVLRELEGYTEGNVFADSPYWEDDEDEDEDFFGDEEDDDDYGRYS